MHANYYSQIPDIPASASKWYLLMESALHLDYPEFIQQPSHQFTDTDADTDLDLPLCIYSERHNRIDKSHIATFGLDL